MSSLATMMEARQSEAREEARRQIAAILWQGADEGSDDRTAELVDLIGPAELTPETVERAAAAIREHTRHLAEASLGEARQQCARELSQQKRGAESLLLAAQMHADGHTAASGRAKYLAATCRAAETAAGEVRRAWPWLFDGRDDEPVEQADDPNAVKVRAIDDDFASARWRSLRVQGQRVRLEDPRVADVVNEWNKARADAAEAEALALEAHTRMVAIEDTLAQRMSALNADAKRAPETDGTPH